MFNPKFYIQAEDSKNQEIAAGIRQLLENANQQVVEREADARYVIAIRESGARPVAAKYGIGSVSDSVIGDNAVKISGGSQVGNLNVGSTQTVHGNLRINMGVAESGDLDELLALLQQALHDAPDAAAKTDIETAAKAVVDEAKQGESNQITRHTLHQAASNIAGVMPTVGVIVYQILALIARLKG